MSARALPVAAALLLLVPAIARAALEPRPDALAPALAAAGWQLQGVTGQAVARFAAQPDGNIAIEAERSVGFLVRRLTEAERAGAATLAWRWRVDAAPPAGDLASATGDDRPLALHVLYPPPDDEGWLGRLRRRMVASAAGPLFAGRVVTYVWGGTAPAGTRLANPHLPDDAVLVILRDSGAPTGVWLDERVDPAADYRRAFGTAPDGPPVAIAISTDTDDRGGLARAAIRPPDAP